MPLFLQYVISMFLIFYLCNKITNFYERMILLKYYRNMDPTMDLSSQLNLVAGRMSDKESAVIKCEIEKKITKLKQKAIKGMKKAAINGKFIYKLELSNEDYYSVYGFIARFEKMEEFKNIKIEANYSTYGERLGRAINFSWENESKYVDNVFEDVVLRNKI